MNKKIFKKHYEERLSVKPHLKNPAYAVDVFFDAFLPNDEKRPFSPELYSLIESYMEDIFVDSLLEIKRKVNLESFDEEWFFEVYVAAINKAIDKIKEKYRIEFEKVGIWATEKEYDKAVKERFQESGLKEITYSKEEENEIQNFFEKYPELKFGLYGDMRELLDKEEKEHLLEKYPWLKKIIEEL